MSDFWLKFIFGWFFIGACVGIWITVTLTSAEFSSEEEFRDARWWALPWGLFLWPVEFVSLLAMIFLSLKSMFHRED